MKPSEIRELTLPELKVRIKEEQDKILRMRLNHAVSAIEKPSEIRDVRRTIARLKTILRERELMEQAKP
ncbi:MAG: 50S ribosomal protein L29 [Bacteroidia bacterium]|jgi:large subunit ribosomal protein L29|nr:50S ribosomal protein L29 [Bacteroidia bacterium]